ncbi:MAG TPA: TraB/GumN family protein [Burkholderiaceae bacterium]|nr:TraB/GumN family protein [Burkholderiaceae bacterium]
MKTRLADCLGRAARRLACLLGVIAVQAAAQPGAPGADCPPMPIAPSTADIQAAAVQARDRGALWRLTRDGRSSYLYGTIHVGRLAWAMPGPQLRAALGGTDIVALEIDPTDPQLAPRLAAPAAAPATLDAALGQRLARRLDAACLPAPARTAIAGQHPALQAITLGVLEARWEGLDAGYAQEFMLAGLARAAQRRIVSLETPESQLAALLPRDEAELRHMLEQALEQLERGQARRAIARLAAAWERGDLEELAAYERWCECAIDEADRRALARLLDERNPGLAEGIDALHRAGGRVLAAVGALHMVGPKALPELLRARGYAVERVVYR